jgi:hypothetical protein
MLSSVNCQASSGSCDRGCEAAATANIGANYGVAAVKRRDVSEVK